MNCGPEYWIWLQKTLGTGNSYDELLQYFGNPERLYESGKKAWLESGLFSEKTLEKLIDSKRNQLNAINDDIDRMESGDEFYNEYDMYHHPHEMYDLSYQRDSIENELIDLEDQLEKLKEKGYNTNVGDEGGFAPDLQSNEEGFQVMDII